jgi:hypothetical protein
MGRKINRVLKKINEQAGKNAGGYSTATEAGSITYPRSVNMFTVQKKYVF